MKEFNRNAIGVPNEIRVIGFDNIPLSMLVEPSLTTVSQPIQQMGMKAAELLIQQIENSEVPAQQIVMQCELIERAST